MDIITADNLQVKPDHTLHQHIEITIEMDMIGIIVVHPEESQGITLTNHLILIIIIDIVMVHPETLTNLPLDHENLTAINIVSLHHHIIQITRLLHLHQLVLAMDTLHINLPDQVNLNLDPENELPPVQQDGHPAPVLQTGASTNLPPVLAITVPPPYQSYLQNHDLPLILLVAMITVVQHLQDETDWKEKNIPFLIRPVLKVYVQKRNPDLRRLNPRGKLNLKNRLQRRKLLRRMTLIDGYVQLKRKWRRQNSELNKLIQKSKNTNDKCEFSKRKCIFL